MQPICILYSFKVMTILKGVGITTKKKRKKKDDISWVHYTTRTDENCEMKIFTLVAENCTKITVVNERTVGLAHNLQLLHTWLKLMRGLP